MPILRKGAYAIGTVQNITTSGMSQQSAAVGASTTIIRVAVNADTFIAIGSNPTASSSTLFMPAGDVEFFAVNEGTDKVAVIQSTASGICSITELA
jgi:anaerobic selenocysteine-containing dehydrogenase